MSRVWLLLLFVSTAAHPQSSAIPPTIPTNINDGWNIGSPISVGLNPYHLDEMARDVENGKAGNIHAIVIEKDGRLVFEQYIKGEDGKWGEQMETYTFGCSSLHDLRSATKSVISALVGIAIGKRQIASTDVPISTLLPAYADILRGDKEQILLHDVLTMSSGLEWDQFSMRDGMPDSDELRLEEVSDPVAFVLSKPVVAPPGERWDYSSGATEVLGAILEQATGMSVEEYARQNLFLPLNITSYEWGRYKTGHNIASWGLRLTPRDAAKIASLYLAHGEWNGRQIIPAWWTIESTRPRIGVYETLRPPFVLSSSYAYQWWVNTYCSGIEEVLVISAIGNGEQRMMFIPSLNMTVTIFAGLYDQSDKDWLPEQLLLRYILPSALDADRQDG